MPNEPPDHPEAPYAGVRLTRADVERLIAEHGGPEGLDLRGADLSQEDLNALDLHGSFLSDAKLVVAILRRANLQGANLQGAYLWDANLQGADLSGANLQGADLSGANLQGADLLGANLQGATLHWAHLPGADLLDANLQGATLQWARLGLARLYGVRVGVFINPQTNTSSDTDLANVDWGGYVLGEELAGEYEQAEAVYRMLKEWHRQHGHYDIASEFAYRENEARRKARWQHVKQLWRELWQPAEASAR